MAESTMAGERESCPRCGMPCTLLLIDHHPGPGRPWRQAWCTRNDCLGGSVTDGVPDRCAGCNGFLVPAPAPRRRGEFGPGDDLACPECSAERVVAARGTPRLPGMP